MTTTTTTTTTTNAIHPSTLVFHRNEIAISAIYKDTITLPVSIVEELIMDTPAIGCEKSYRLFQDEYGYSLQKLSGSKLVAAFTIAS